jgi:hypothetical protein
VIHSLTHLVVWLNAVANALGRTLLAPIGAIPGWLSATIIAVASGVFFLFVFKYTSNQRAIQHARSDIKAHLLALRLFTDSASVALRSQGRILLGAFRLLLLAVVPMLIMIVPASLFLGQLALWYESRPLRVGEEAVVTMQLNGDAVSAWPDVRLQPSDAAEISIGPIRVQSQRAICWNIKARQKGYHHLVFSVNEQPHDKELAIGNGYMRVSVRRPGWQWADVLVHPAETPFGPGSPVQSIAIDYPERSSWTSGTGSWLVYWLAGSLLSGLCCRRLFNVHV